MEPAVNSSGLKSADGVICARPCIFYGVTLLTDGTNAGTIVLYDNASAASGTVVAKSKQTGAALMATHMCDVGVGVVCNAGIYADVTGTGAEYIVYYSLL